MNSTSWWVLPKKKEKAYRCGLSPSLLISLSHSQCSECAVPFISSFVRSQPRQSVVQELWPSCPCTKWAWYWVWGQVQVCVLLCFVCFYCMSVCIHCACTCAFVCLWVSLCVAIHVRIILLRRPDDCAITSMALSLNLHSSTCNQQHCARFSERGKLWTVIMATEDCARSKQPAVVSMAKSFCTHAR